MAETEPAPVQQRQSKGAAALAVLLGVGIATAVGISTTTQKNESGGRVILHAYADSGHVWTICDGIIRWPSGKAVQRGDVATPDQCEAMRYDELIRHAKPLIQCLPMLRGRANQVSALVDLSYNVGTGAVCNGSVGTDIRAGHWIDGGKAILLYDKVTFSAPQPNLKCVKLKNRPDWACVIPGLAKRRNEDKAQFDDGRPAEGTMGPAPLPAPVVAPVKPAPAPVVAPKPVAPPTPPAPKPAPPAPKTGFWAWLKRIF